ncbi:MAG: ATP-binding cassette domain-containing protein [Pseudomonadota bacterium]
MKQNCVVEMEHVWTCFDDMVIHRDINLCLASGEILGLVGSSGSGKTTLLREMIGLQDPNRGRVYVFGKNLSEIGTGERQGLRNRCGVLFQGGALFSALNVFDNVAFPVRELRILDENLIRRLVCMKLGMVGLNQEAALRMPSELSGGMVTRVGLARALVLEPELLFLDEPTSGLDPIASQDFVKLVRSLRQELGFSVVMITHDLHTLADLCDRIAVLAEQQLIAFGSLQTVRDCDHAFTRQFFHGERANRIFDHPASI